MSFQLSCQEVSIRYSKLPRIYYQFQADRLSTCPLTVHALLHIADDIVKCGPPCMTWSFVMERWCSYLLSFGMKSRFRPYTTLALHQFRAAQVNELQNRYNLTELGNMPANSVLSCFEQNYPDSDCTFTCSIRNVLTLMISNAFLSRSALHFAFTTPSCIQARAVAAPQDLRLLCHDPPKAEASILPAYPSAGNAFMGQGPRRKWWGQDLNSLCTRKTSRGNSRCVLCSSTHPFGISNPDLSKDLF